MLVMEIRRRERKRRGVTEREFAIRAWHSLKDRTEGLNSKTYILIKLEGEKGKE